jgi:hypothetical protein
MLQKEKCIGKIKTSKRDNAVVGVATKGHPENKKRNIKQNVEAGLVSAQIKKSNIKNKNQREGRKAYERNKKR